jgi:hypothetical protein
MSHNHPQAQPQEPDPSASTQMFQAFVNGEAPGAAPAARATTPAAPASASGPRPGLILGVVVAVVALAAVAWLALG